MKSSRKFIIHCSGILFLAVCITWALKAQQTKPEEKKYRVELTIPEWEKAISQIQWVQTQIKQSDMPSRNSVYCNDSILTPLIQQIFGQLNAQIQAEQRKVVQPKDTTKPNIKHENINFHKTKKN